MTAALHVMGRQPAEARITPSKPNPWYGTITGGTREAGAIKGGSRFTAEQDRELARRGIDDTVDVQALTVRRSATMAEAWWPDTQPPPVFEFECPVIGTRADGRLVVISPAGDAKLVQPDGWTSAPGRSKWRPAK